MYFPFQKGPGPGTGHPLHDHGNSVEAARSQHPTEHKFHLHLLSGSIGCSKKSIQKSADDLRVHKDTTDTLYVHQGQL